MRVGPLVWELCDAAATATVRPTLAAQMPPSTATTLTARGVDKSGPGCRRAGPDQDRAGMRWWVGVLRADAENADWTTTGDAVERVVARRRVLDALAALDHRGGSVSGVPVAG
ncbi:hypothetical protein HBB16_09955 [Pseudonocardia sp. MCCB 268]|nr:hypothetical protein [Pseudonocardia cytotoxica]